MATTTVNPPIQTQFNTGSDIIWSIDGTYSAHVDLAASQTSYVLRFSATFTPVVGAPLSVASSVYSLTMRNNGVGLSAVSIFASNGSPTSCAGGTQITLSASSDITVSGDTATLTVDVRVTGDSFYATSTTTVGTISILVNYTAASLFNGQMLINF